LLLISDLGHAQTTSKSPIKSPQGAVNRSLDKSTNSNDDSTENIDENALIGNQRTLQERLVLKVFHEYLECREIRPRLRKLNDLLMLTRYTGPENEYCIERSLLFTRDQLLNTIQCSRMEFDAGIHLYRVIEIGGRLRILDCEYEYRIISLMLNIIAEMGWALDEIERDATIELLVPNIAPAEIVTGLFDLYTKPTEGKTRDNGQLLFGYCEELVCQIIAQNILQQGMKFHINDFMTTWQNALPDGMQINVRIFL
jgi:sister chromatid cohesion protein DCC1